MFTCFSGLRSLSWRLLTLGLLLSAILAGSIAAGFETMPEPDGSGSAPGTQPDGMPKLQIVRELPREDYTFGVTWSSDSMMLAAYSEHGNLVTVWNVDGTIVRELHRRGVADVPDSLALISKTAEIVTPPSSNGMEHVAFSVFDIRTGEVVHQEPGLKPEWHGRSNWVHHLALSPDQSLLAAGFGTTTLPVVLYSTEDWTKITEISIPKTDILYVLRFSRDGRYLAIGLSSDVLIYDVAARQVLRRIKSFPRDIEDCCIKDVAFNPDASLIAVSIFAGLQSSDCKRLPGGTMRCTRRPLRVPLRVFRTADGASVASFPEHISHVLGMDWSGGGRFIALSGLSGLYLWAPLHPDKWTRESSDRDSSSVAFAPTGKWLAECIGRFVKIYEIDPYHG